MLDCLGGTPGMEKQKKLQPWVLPRHRFGRNLAYVLLVPYTKWKYHVTSERFAAQGDRPYLIL